jgi:GNAT superfamily N-acetyltransferase
MPGPSYRTPFSIREACADDLAALVEIERAAGETFRALGMDLVADDDRGSIEDLMPYAEDRRAFVSLDAEERPVAYLLLDLVDGNGHVEQVSVHPMHARQGIGRRLFDRAAAWASERELPALTVTTYVDVPWNGPYYRRLGFRFLPADQETPGLRRLRAHERAAGLDAWPRACMRREVGRGPA